MRARSVSPARSELIAGRAWALRRYPTLSEQRLWELALRGSQLGVAFRRQLPIGARYVADFAAPSVRVIVEVDGPVHAGRRGRDARRDRWLRRAGWRVVRLEAALVLGDLPAAIARIREAIAAGGRQ